MHKVLIVDDDHALLDVNSLFLAQQGYQVFCADCAEKALSILTTTQLDCIVLDIDLPDYSGLEVCRRAREFTALPVIFLSAYTEEEIRLMGLSIGDDYMCKPFSLAELEMRIRLRMKRRFEEVPPETLQFGSLILNFGDRTVSYENRQNDFSRIEFDVLAFLAQHPNQIFSYSQLYDRVWKEPLGESRHNLQARVAVVRQKLFDLCPDREYIQTVRGKGYQFIP